MRELLKKTPHNIPNTEFTQPPMAMPDDVKHTDSIIAYRKYYKIYKKHLENIDQTFDDDSALFTIYGEKVVTVNGSKTNLKITDKEDLEIFKKDKKSYIFWDLIKK